MIVEKGNLKARLFLGCQKGIEVTQEPVINVALDENLPAMLRVKAVNAIGLSRDLNGLKILQECLQENNPVVSSWAQLWIDKPQTIGEVQDISTMKISVPSKQARDLIREYEILAARLRSTRNILNDMGKKGITFDNPSLIVEHFGYYFDWQKELLDIDSKLFTHRTIGQGIREDIALFLTQSDLETLKRAGLKVRPLLPFEIKVRNNDSQALQYLKSIVRQHKFTSQFLEVTPFLTNGSFQDFKKALLTTASQAEKEDFKKSWELLSDDERDILKKRGLDLSDLSIV